MNLLSRPKFSPRIRNLLLQSVTPLQQSNSYSTKITHTIEKSQHLTDGRTQTCSESSSSFSDRFKKQIARPKPREIPYQGKVANSVNLIGYVKTPVHFEADSNGNHFAATLISQKKGSLLIPVVFEGDLAHVVSYHVKENNRVLVSGRLSTDSMRFALSGCVVNYHIVADNLNFVEGSKRNSSMKPRVSFSEVGIEKLKTKEWKKMVDNDDDDDGGDDDEFTKQWKEALEEAKVKRWGENLESKPE